MEFTPYQYWNNIKYKLIMGQRLCGDFQFNDEHWSPCREKCVPGGKEVSFVVKDCNVLERQAGIFDKGISDSYTQWQFVF